MTSPSQAVNIESWLSESCYTAAVVHGGWHDPIPDMTAAVRLYDTRHDGQEL